MDPVQNNDLNLAKAPPAEPVTDSLPNSADLSTTIAEPPKPVPPIPTPPPPPIPNTPTTSFKTAVLTPEPAFTNSPKSGLKKILLAFFIIVLLLVIGGGALGAYAVAYDKVKLANYPEVQKKVSEFVISLPFMPKTPKYLLAKTSYVHQNVTKESFDFSMAVDSEDIVSALGLSGLDLQAKGQIDYSNPKNIKVVVNGSVTKDFNAELIKLDKILYFRINKVPQVFLTMLGFKSGDFDSLIGKWVSYDTTPLDTEARKSIEDKEIDPLSKEYVDEEFQKYLDEQVLGKMKVEVVKEDGFEVYKITLNADADLIDHMGKKLEEQSSGGGKTLKTLGAKTTKLSEIVKSLSWQINIDKKDFYTRKMLIKSDIEADSLDSGSLMMGTSTDINKKTKAKIAFAAKFGNFGEEIKTAAPSGAISAEEYLNQASEIFNKKYQSMAENDNQIIARSRDAKRQADLQTLRSALELYKADSKKYPARLTDLKGPYLIEIPKDPTGLDYYYLVSFDQKSYDLCANLESAGSALTKSCPNTLYNFGVKNP